MLAILKQIIAKPNIAVDLGTANTRISAAKLGKVTEKSSAIRPDNHNKTRHIADEYISYLNNRLVTRPLRGGVIVDVNNAVTLLKPMVRRTCKGLRHPVSLACAPTDTSEKERDLLAEAVLHAGVSRVAIVPEVWAAAIGAGLDISLPRAQVLIDIGEGVTDMAVIRDGRITFASAIRTACSDLQKAVRTAILSRHKVYLYPQELERLTHELSSLGRLQPSPHKLIKVNGINIFKKASVTIEVDRHDIVSAMEPIASKILNMIESGFRQIPESLFHEISASGISLTGGGACIHGIDRLIASKTGLDVRIASDPLHSVINGAIQTLTDWKGKGCWWNDLDWPNLMS